MRQSDKSGGQNQRWTPIFSISALLLLGLACNLPEGLPISTPAGPGARVYTSVAETLVVLEVEGPVVETETNPSGTQTPDATEPTETLEGLVTINLSENTNCRTGQSSSLRD